MAAMSSTSRGELRKRAVGDALDGHSDQRRHDGGHDHHERDGDDRGERAGVEEADVLEERGREVAGEGADHEDIAVGEVDHAQDAVDHRVAEGDEGVHAAQRGTADEQVHPDVDAVLARREGQVGTHHDDQHHDDAEGPQERGDGRVEGALVRLGTCGGAVVPRRGLACHRAAVSPLGLELHVGLPRGCSVVSAIGHRTGRWHG